MMMKRNTKVIHFYTAPDVVVLTKRVKASRVDAEIARVLWLHPNYSATVV
jgi:hypothetical protein